MRSHQPKETANRRLAGGIWFKLALIALVALLCVALPQMFSAHAGGGQKAPKGGFLFTVTTTDDHNDFSCDGTDCTLREAIDAANNIVSPDTIDFSVTGTINLMSVLPDITDDVEISGPGSNVMIVQQAIGVVTFRIFNVTTTGTVTFSGLTISGGGAQHGGGIQNFSTGTVNVTNCAISGNGAISGGGGIRNNGTLNVTNSIISGNNTVGSGGGILNNVALNVTNSIISGNNCNNFGGGIINGDVGSTANITNSTISGNTSGESGGGISNFNGLCLLNVTNSTIFGNTADLSGGGIQNFSSGTVNVVNSTISNNEAGLALSSVGDGFGGGIFNQAGPLTITNSTINNNKAIDGASSTGKGGGIGNINGEVTVNNSTINNNSATAGGGINNLFLI